MSLTLINFLFKEILAVCHERDLVRQNLDGHLNELRDAINTHTDDITGIVDALEPLVGNDLDDPENASSPDSDSINTQFGKCFSVSIFSIFHRTSPLRLFFGP